jgi:uncharacterized protein YciI
MLFMVRFTDKVDCLALRQEHLAAHIAWLDRYKDVVLIGGSLRDDVEILHWSKAFSERKTLVW